jgi:DNA repair photolyase
MTAANSAIDHDDPAQEAVAGIVAERRRGRGAVSNHTGRYEMATKQSFDDGWDSLVSLEPFRTNVRIETAKSIITTNDSPDISFDQSINPYRGCEHGCVYCYARPTHCYLGHSAGLDFETELYVKGNAATLLEKELGRRGYVTKTIALGAVTDPYQPIERTYQISRQVLEVLDRTNHPVGIVTKSATITRDIDILGRMASRGLVKVALSVTTLDRDLARRLEPRAATPGRRLDAIKALTEAGIPTQVMVAPIIPGLNDHEIETILAAAYDAGARQAGYVLLRLPLELKQIFREWLMTEYPDRAAKVIKLLRSMYGGQDYVATFGLRQRGQGPYAALIADRFRGMSRRLGLNATRVTLRTDLFRAPVTKGKQMQLL